MPRLLLVDDNPSIHRIAESLLTGSSVELVCVESGEEALRRVNAGERFDVALLDTVLGPGGMDGWSLLDRLRQTPATAAMPIALMAGVLDAVDPLRLEKAPIQGFLRKPVELRDLEERLHAFMAAPVEGAGRGTVPGARLQDWMSEAPAAAQPARGPEPENDLLVLTAEDLLEPLTGEFAIPTGLAKPEPAREPEAHAEPELHIEELDMETLHGVAAAAPVATPAPEPELPEIPSINLDEPLSHEMLAGLTPTAHAEGVAGLAAGAAGLALGAAALTHAQADSSHEHLSHADLTAAPTPAALEPEMELETLHGVEPETLRGPATPSTSAAPAAPGDANAMVQAILADPNARQALLKALLSQGGEQVLREVAWEVMPDLASKLQK